MYSISFINRKSAKLCMRVCWESNPWPLHFVSVSSNNNNTWVGTGVIMYNNLLSGFSSAAACCKSLSWMWDLCSLCSAWKSYARDKTQPMLSECPVDSDCSKTSQGAHMCLSRHKHTNWRIRASIQTVSTWFFCSCFWWARDSSLSFSTRNCLASSSMRWWFDTAST